jgi:hypothetical protein
VPYGLLLVWLAVLYSDDIIELKGTIARYILHCSLHLFIVFWKGCQLKGERERRKNVYLAVAHNRRKIYFETVAALYYRFSHHYARLYPASRLSVLSVAYKFPFCFLILFYRRPTVIFKPTDWTVSWCGRRVLDDAPVWGRSIHPPIRTTTQTGLTKRRKIKRYFGDTQRLCNSPPSPESK